MWEPSSLPSWTTPSLVQMGNWLVRWMEYVREGDTLLITKLDRLAPLEFGPGSICSTSELYRIVQSLKA